MPAANTASESAAAHTPGPWDWDSNVIPPDGPDRYAVITAADGDIVIASYNEMREFSPTEGEANARLIAAAPDMAKDGTALLMALAKILPSEVAIVHASVEWRALYQHAHAFRAAIAKATGGNP